nr:OB-fold-containig protein [Shewanella sp. UCD-KL12]
MVDFLLTQANLPFTISLSFVVILAVLEALSLSVGFSLVKALEKWAPRDTGLEHTDVSVNGLASVASWLCLDKLPLLIWFVLALVSFTLAGFVSNYIALTLYSNLLPQSAALPIALFVTAFACRYIGEAIASVLPRNELGIVSTDGLLGSVGTVTVGCAIKGNPSEALVQDQYQQKHYVLVEPESKGIEFNSGTQVVLLRREGGVWSAARFDS